MIINEGKSVEESNQNVSQIEEVIRIERNPELDIPPAFGIEQAQPVRMDQKENVSLSKSSSEVFSDLPPFFEYFEERFN